MGKASSSSTAPMPTALMKTKKKKGRPPKTPLVPPKPSNGDSPLRRSAPRNPNFTGEFDDDDDRMEKKVKLVVRLPQFDQHNSGSAYDSDSGASGSDSESEDRDRVAKKRKINAVDGGSDDAASVQAKDAAKETVSLLESGPTTPLPDKKLLLFILDRLQKKDTHGVFSEPVDLNELPDYLDIVEKPMDFATIRKKLDSRAYKYLEELEADVFLLCSNAMEYNAQNTVFYRQARSIQELAKRDFENLKHEGENGELEPKVVRRGRPPGNKNQKKSLEASPIDRVATEPSSDGAALQGGEDKATSSNTYNLRKAPAVNRFRSSDLYVSSYQSRHGENQSQSSINWNDEFPASILRADMKQGKKHFTVDENKRDTYTQFHPTSSANGSTLFLSSIGDAQRLVPVGLQDPLSYARSLARFAADLGPVAWRVASKKIESILPPGVPYGPGWVGDDGAPSQPFSFSSEKQKSSNSSAGDGNPNKPTTPSTSDLSSAVGHSPTGGTLEAAVRNLKSQNELGIHGNAASPWSTPFPPLHKPVYQSQRNGFGGMFWHDTSAIGSATQSMPGQYSMMGGVPFRSQATQEPIPIPRNDPSSSHSLPFNCVYQDETQSSQHWRNSQPGYPVEQGKSSNPYGEAEHWSLGKSSLQASLAQQQRNGLSSLPHDLNTRIPIPVPIPVPGGGSSPGSSSQQPDLVLQL